MNKLNKSLLRNNLFELYFQNNEGILAKDFIEKMSFIHETYQIINEMCEKNIEYFDSFDSVSKIKEIYSNGRKYLVLEYGIANFIVIDCLKKDNIQKEEFFQLLRSPSFQVNFQKRDIETNLFFYDLDFYQGNIEELLNFYEKNKCLFSLPTKVFYQIKLLHARTYFSISLEKNKAQLSFETNDHFLYEQLYFSNGLEPSRMQDATKKVGLEKMREILTKTKEIVIPFEVIPEKLCQEYDNRCFSPKSKILSRTKKQENNSINY